MSQLVHFDNSLREKAPNFLELKEIMQQEGNLYAIFLIKDFHCRCKLNKVESNKIPSIVPNLKTILLHV